MSKDAVRLASKEAIEGLTTQNRNGCKRWIFLRGLARESGHWYDFTQSFLERFSNCELETLDLPGAGPRHKELSPLSIKTLVDDLRSQSKWIHGNGKISTPVNILAISLGGMIALKWAELYPEDCNSMVLINSSSQESPPLNRMQPEAWISIGQALVEKSTFARELQVLKLTSNLRSTSELTTLAHRGAKLNERHPFSPLNFARQLWLAKSFKLSPDTQNPLNDTTLRLSAEIPRLFLNASKDRLAHPSCSEVLAQKFPSSQLITHPAAGHDLPLDDPDWVLDEIGKFLDSL